MKGKIFKSSEVSAILDGRKTRFSEVVPGVPDGNYDIVHSKFLATEGRAGFVNLDLANPYDDTVDVVPKYQLGQVIYVREAWAKDWSGAGFCYKSDTDNPIYLDENWKWNSPATMPREAARIFLEVTGVIVQRLSEVTEEQAIAEGVERDGEGWRSYEMIHRGPHKGKRHPHSFVPNKSPITSFHEMFGERVGRYIPHQVRIPEDYDPWVFAYTFKQIEKTMKLTIEHLAKRLPYGVKELHYGRQIREITGIRANEEGGGVVMLDGGFDRYPVSYITPILFPIECLTREVTVKGEVFVPFERIAKIEAVAVTGAADTIRDIQAFRRGISFETVQQGVAYKYGDYSIEITHFTGTKFHKKASSPDWIFTQWNDYAGVLTFLYENHIDTDGLIPAGLAVSVFDLPENPYE